MGLDPIKWAMAWALNEDGVRSRVLHKAWLRRQERDATKTGGGRGARLCGGWWIDTELQATRVHACQPPQGTPHCAIGANQLSTARGPQTSRPPTLTAGAENTFTVGAAAANYTNPLGRASMVTRPPPEMLARASVVPVSESDRARVSRESDCRLAAC